MDALDFIDSIAALAHPDEEMLDGFVQGRLSLDRAKAVEGHLTRCPHCRELAEMFGWSFVDRQSAEIVPLRTDRKEADAKPPAIGHVRSGVTWRRAEAERLAAADDATSRDGRYASANRADLVQFVPGATDGEVALGYLCAGGVDIIVTGVGDRPAKVLLNGTEYEVRNGAANEPRVVEGLTRQHVAVWLAAGGPDGGFTVIYP